MRITKRIQQALAGNWGKPDKCEKDVKIPDPIFPSARHTGIKRNKKKEKKPRLSPWHCPFCNKELPLDQERIDKLREERKDRPYLSIWEEMYRIRRCECGAYEIKDGCPACKSDIWFNPHTEIHMHQNWGCGFVGKKLKRN